MLSPTMRLRLYRWHAWAGLFGGVFLIVICLSGAVLVFKPAIQRQWDWGGYAFDTQATPAGPMSPDRAMDVLRAEIPHAKPIRFWLPARADSMDCNGLNYWLTLPGGRSGGPTDFLIDPYRAQIVARTRLHDGWGFWLRQVHLRLLYGQFWGRWIVGFFGIALAFATLSGLCIYLKFNANAWIPKLRLGRGSRVFWADLHKAVGMGALAFNLLFGATGAVLGLETLYDRYVSARPTTITKPPRAAGPSVLPAEDPLAFCIAKTRSLLPGTEPVGINFSYGRRPAYTVSVSYPAAALIQEATAGVTFDARTGEVLRVRDLAQAPFATRAFYAMEPLHFGRLGGFLWVKMLWCAMGSTGGLLSITGYGIYLMRSIKKRRSRRAIAKNGLSTIPVHQPTIGA